MNNTSAPFIPEELRQYLTPDGALDMSKVGDVGTFTDIPDGQYVAKLSAVDVQDPNPNFERPSYSLQVAFTILEGKHKELDIRQWWSLEVLPPKEGKEGVWAPDIARMKQAAAAVGAPIAHFHAFEPEKARRELAQALGRKTLDISVKSRSYTPKGTTEKKSRKEVVVLGIHKAQAGRRTAAEMADVPAVAQATIPQQEPEVAAQIQRATEPAPVPVEDMSDFL